MDTTDEWDALLLQQTVEGDRRAFETLFDRYVRTVTRYAWGLVAMREDVEDVVQDTFLTAWQKAETVHLVGDSLLPWLLVTCRNQALNLLRRRRRNAHAPLTEWDLPLLAVDEEADVARARLQLVMQEMEKLSGIDRRICELCLIEGRSYKDAAKALGTSAGAVGKRLERARLRMRRAIEGEY